MSLLSKEEWEKLDKYMDLSINANEKREKKRRVAKFVSYLITTTVLFPALLVFFVHMFIFEEVLNFRVYQWWSRHAYLFLAMSGLGWVLLFVAVLKVWV